MMLLSTTGSTSEEDELILLFRLQNLGFSVSMRIGRDLGK